MNIIELVASLVESLAWPVTVAYLSYLFKDKLGELLLRLTKLKHKDTEIEFKRGLEELESLDEDVIEGEIIKPKLEVDSTEYKEKYIFLMNLSLVSPRSAVVEAWRSVENSLAKALTKFYPEQKETKYFPPKAMEQLLRERILTEQEITKIRVLRRLRNTAVHADDFDLSGMPIESYIDNALTLVDVLENQNP